MEKAKEKKRLDIERELETHVDLITDEKVKNYIKKKKEAKT